MGNPFTDAINFANVVSEAIASTFRGIGLFLKQVNLAYLTWFVFPLVVLLFFLAISAMFVIPMRLVPIVEENILLFKRFFAGKYKSNKGHKKYKKKYY